MPEHRQMILHLLTTWKVLCLPYPLTHSAAFYTNSFYITTRRQNIDATYFYTYEGRSKSFAIRYDAQMAQTKFLFYFST